MLIICEKDEEFEIRAKQAEKLVLEKRLNKKS